MPEMYRNKENTVYNQLFMGEVGRVKADVNRVSWNDWSGVFKKKKDFNPNLFN